MKDEFSFSQVVTIVTVGTAVAGDVIVVVSVVVVIVLVVMSN